MFRKKDQPTPEMESTPPQSRVTSILGADTTWKGELSGKGGVRIEGLFEGKIHLKGMVVVDPKGRLESDLISADVVIVAGSVRSDIKADRVEIRSTGRVWGDVTALRFSTEEGAYLRGKIQMEEPSPERAENLEGTGDDQEPPEGESDGE